MRFERGDVDVEEISRHPARRFDLAHERALGAEPFDEVVAPDAGMP